jgi:membrane associated rhomboid family serine protease
VDDLALPKSRVPSEGRFPAPVFLALLVTNLIALVLCWFGPGLRELLAMVPYAVWHGQAWRLVSYAWVHSGIWHLGGNMLLLLPCALYLERRLGSGRFALLYLLSVFVGGLILLLTGQAAVGASGAVCAMAILAALTLMSRDDGPGWLLLPELIAGLFVLVFWLAPMMWRDLLGLFRHDGISHIGHLGGFLTGWGIHRLRLARPGKKLRLPT